MQEEKGAEHTKRPFEITLDAIFWGIVGSFIIFLGVFSDTAEVFRFFIVFSVGLFFLVMSYGLWTGRSWSYISFFVVIVLFTYLLVSDIAEKVSANNDFGILTVLKWAFFLFVIISEAIDMRKPHVKEYLKIKS